MITFGKTDFLKDILKGKAGELIFAEDFLYFLDVKFEDVTGSQGFQIMDTDFKAKIGLYEIKTNYHDDKKIIIEEFTNNNKAYGAISQGWFYKSKANVLVFVSKDTRTMILIPFTPKFKARYEEVKVDYDLIPNRVSEYNGHKWQSAFRKIPLSAINGWFAFYKKTQG